MRAQSRRLRGSLGDSWGNADYETGSDGGASIQSASDFGSEPELEDDFSYGADVPTPSPYRTTRASSKDPYDTPNRTAIEHAVKRPAQSSQSTPRSQFASPPLTPSLGSLEPSFIMPSIYKTADGFQTGSPLRGSQARLHQSRLLGEHTSASLQTPSKRVSSRSERFQPDMDYDLDDSAGLLQIDSPHRTSQVRLRQSRLSGGRASSSPQTLGRRVSSQSDQLDQPLESAGPQKSTAKIHAPPHHKNPPPQGFSFYVNVLMHYVVLPALGYLSGVVGHAAGVLQPVLGVAFALFLVWFFTIMLSTYLSSAVTTALTPLCILPGSTYLIPFCQNQEWARADAKNPLFDDITQIEYSFADMVSSSKDAYSLPMTMKESEAAIRDIRTLVKHSNLRSKAELENEISYFVETAKQASADLTTYNSRVGSVMDRVIVTNQWTERVLHDIEEKGASIGALSRIASGLNPFSLVTAPRPTLYQQVFDLYLKHIAENKEHISGLITKAHALLAILNNMDERLDVIADIATRDGAIISRDRDELLSQLWTKLGGNSATKKNINKQLSVLSEVSRYKKDAVKHVHGSLVKLQEMAAQLENLREDVAAPEVLGWRDDVPLQYHIESVRRGLERLKEVRGENREVERGEYRRALDQGTDKSRLIDGAPVAATKVRGGLR